MDLTTLVIIESPFGGNCDERINDNIRFARWVCRAVFVKDAKCAFATHLFGPQFLDDKCPVERQSGMDWPFAWHPQIPHWFASDLGWSNGMLAAQDRCKKRNIPYEAFLLSSYHPESWERYVRGLWPPSTPRVHPSA